MDNLENQLCRIIKNYCIKYEGRYEVVYGVKETKIEIENYKYNSTLISDKIYIDILFNENKVLIQTREGSSVEIQELIYDIWFNVFEFGFDIEMFNRSFKYELEKACQYVGEVNEDCVFKAITNFLAED